nr:hypothetical protein [Fimbriiglobus sp.]
MSSTHSPADVLSKQQRAILLHQLANAANGELTLSKAAKPPAWAAKQFGLAPEVATAVLDVLIAEQLVAGSEKGKTKKVAITRAGREALEQLAEFVPQPPPPAPPKPPKKSPAEVVADKVRAKVAELDEDAVVTEKALGKPGGTKVTEAQTQAFADTLAELLSAGTLHTHPGGKYGKRPVPTLAELVRKQVEETLATKAGPFKPADLSRPKKGASPEEQQAHADVLGKVIAELLAAKNLFPHDGGKYGPLPPPPPPDFPDRELREVYVLHQFSRAPNRTITKADIELAFPGQGKPDLKALKAKFSHVVGFRGVGCFEMGAPATRQTLEQLVAAGDLRYTGEAEAGEYTLTDAGAKRLEHARTTNPVLPPVGNPATPDDAAMREKWEAFVLLRLTEAASFTAGESAVFAGGYPKGSKLNE